MRLKGAREGRELGDENALECAEHCSLAPHSVMVNCTLQQDLHFQLERDAVVPHMAKYLAEVSSARLRQELISRRGIRGQW